LRLNSQVNEERIARLDEESGFRNLASSNKKDEAIRLREIEAGERRQEEIRGLLKAFADGTGSQLYKDRDTFKAELQRFGKQHGVTLSAPELKAVLNALSEQDETANDCRDARSRPEPDPELRDTENVPLKQDIEAYFKTEVLPHVPDAWIDYSKTKVGYEIPLNRHFYVYEPPRPLEEIEADIKKLESEILSLLQEVTA
jgi:type I restriction enzyme M protein